MVVLDTKTWARFILALPASLALLAFANSSAQALCIPVQQGIICPPFPAAEFVAPTLMRERAYELSSSVKSEVGRQLKTRPFSGSIENVADLENGYTVTPTADVEETTESTGFSVWGYVSYGEMDFDDPIFGFKGPQNYVLGGVGYRVSDRIVIGGLVNAGGADIKTNFDRRFYPEPGKYSANSKSVGGYAGYAITDNIVWDASVAHSWSNNEIFTPVSLRGRPDVRLPSLWAEFNAKSWNINSNLTGYWYHDLTRFSPSVGVNYVREKQDAYSDNYDSFYPEQIAKVGTFTFGAAVGQTFQFSNGQTAEPHIQVQGELDFLKTGTTSLTPGVPTSPLNKKRLDVRVSGGIDFELLYGVSLSMVGDVGGLNQKNYLTYSGGGKLSLQF